MPYINIQPIIETIINNINNNALLEDGRKHNQIKHAIAEIFTEIINPTNIKGKISFISKSNTKLNGPVAVVGSAR